MLYPSLPHLLYPYTSRIFTVVKRMFSHSENVCINLSIMAQSLSVTMPIVLEIIIRSMRPTADSNIAHTFDIGRMLTNATIFNKDAQTRYLWKEL